MKYRNMLPFVALSVLILTSCDDNKMEWYKDPTHGAVTSSELPLSWVAAWGWMNILVTRQRLPL